MTIGDQIRQHNEMIAALSEGKDVSEKVDLYAKAQEQPKTNPSFFADMAKRFALAFGRKQAKKVQAKVKTPPYLQRKSFGDIMVKKMAGVAE
jgi:hypothetical protein